MELMKEAELFFLDEPTSGLDSASSLLVVTCLHFLASKGVTVPRTEIFNLMDRLLLLAPGGRIAYFGPVFDLQTHFSNLKYTCNEKKTSIADFIMVSMSKFMFLIIVG